LCKRRRTEPAATIVEAIVDGVEGFRGDAPQGDDLTVVVVKITA
jgi:serine phosphatase RsbU (regulator of sigma subunit)